ncbi:metallo-beta-lactamase family protein RNA-specific [Photobacterium aphoticum]|uniref:Metallo-beta-lactamase family protein RNA-specific n=1 Tax=Photobacterium aphoticum TaxID=754436 RepID=A0A090R0L6_9GAMM|nr:metallo-beta-lactamase family protein RNA-specific [Photobacterium aphoticum]
MQIIHHGAYEGVTGSCHELRWADYGILVDCGLFQGAEAKKSLNIDFPIGHIKALLITHCHIDHIGRIPWLLAAGFRGPIFTSEATAALLPLMLDDGLKIQLNLNRAQRNQFLSLVSKLLRPVPFDCLAPITLPNGERINVQFHQAGHILGSAYVEIELPNRHVVVFSGDLGPSKTPLLVDPEPPRHVDTLVIESTYGDRNHDRSHERDSALAQVINRSLADGGVILIPAFSVGRTQELLFDIETLMAEIPDIMPEGDQTMPGPIKWNNLPVILDSPLALKITEQYELFQRLWAKEAKQKVQLGRHPLSFYQCVTVDSHDDHEALVKRLKTSGEPAIVVAASGMCTGGRVLNYLKALLPDPTTDVVLVGYQAEGTLGKQLLSGASSVRIQHESVDVKAQIHTLPGYSAHADQADLVKFVAGIEQGPSMIHIVHGEYDAQKALAGCIKEMKPECEVMITAEKTMTM